jgi:hypothetical protein
MDYPLGDRPGYRFGPLKNARCSPVIAKGQKQLRQPIRTARTIVALWKPQPRRATLIIWAMSGKKRCSKEVSMARAAEYIVVTDVKKRIGEGIGGMNVSCELPKNYDRGSRPMLTFMVDTVGDLDDFKFEIELFPFQGGPQGPLVVYSANFSGPHYHSIQEVLPTDALGPTGGDIQFNFKGGDGQMDVSDIVVWVHVNT